MNYQELYNTTFEKNVDFKLPNSDGLFVVFEGIDGSGKSSLIRALSNELSRKNYKISCFAEPTKEGAGLKLRKIFAAEENKTTEALDLEIELFLQDRSANLKNNIIPALEKNHIVLLDRYLFSSGAYQGREGYSSYSILKKNLKMGFPLPHILFYVDTDVDTCIQRISLSRSNTDFFEKKDTLKNIAANYKELMPDFAINLSGKQNRQSIIFKALDKIEKTKSNSKRS